MEQVSSGLLGLGARKERQWPPELLPLAHGLYNLQRSPMLAGPAMLPYAVHPDERLLLMLQLLAAGCAASVAQVCVCVRGRYVEQWQEWPLGREEAVCACADMGKQRSRWSGTALVSGLGVSVVWVKRIRRSTRGGERA